MKKRLFAILITVALLVTMMPQLTALAAGGAYTGYTPLDPSQPITFDGETVTWGGKTFTLDDNTIFLDYRLDSEQIKDNPYAFNSLQAAKAAGALKAGSISKPMTLLTAPGVYWVDDPDDGYTRPNRPEGNPETGLYGMTINCNWLYFYGLNTNRSNVVFACARGQTQGSQGNFNLMSVTSTGFKTENVTFGNYANVDLEFPLDTNLPEGQKLSHPKWYEGISQAQLFGGSVTNAIAINTAFISRLNLLPFNALYINCHTESSGHAGGGSTYINSTINLYNTNFSGGTQFYNCDIYITPLAQNTAGIDKYEQAFGDSTSVSGRAVDTRFWRGEDLLEADIPAGISWARRNPKTPTTRSYQYNVTLDNEPYIIQDHFTPGSSVVIPEDSDLLGAYRVEVDGAVYYNLQNILGLANFSGNNAVYLPYANVEKIAAAEAADGKADGYYRTVPRTASVSRTGSGAIRTGNSAMETTRVTASAESGRTAGLGAWSFKAVDLATWQPAEYVTLTPASANAVDVTANLTGYEARNVMIVATNELGIEAALQLTVQPEYIDAPAYTADGMPRILDPENGVVKLDYDFEVKGDGLEDQSVISWWRVAGDGAELPVSVSRNGKPEQEYILNEGDIGSTLKATIRPKYNVSELGAETATVVSSRKITAADVPARTNEDGKEISWVETNFKNMPTDAQTNFLPGTWTVAGGWTWADGSSTQGSAGYQGFNQSARSARIFYTPADGKYGSMTVTAKFAPNKTAGQGFGSAPQFHEFYIKADTMKETVRAGTAGTLETGTGEPAIMNGYGLRFQRLAAGAGSPIEAFGWDPAGGGNGVAVSLMKYTDGVAERLPLSNGDQIIPGKTFTTVMTSAYISECTVELSIVDGKLTADITATEEARSGDAYGYLRDVHLEANVEMNDFGGSGALYDSTVGDNSTVMTYWKAEMEKAPAEDFSDGKVRVSLSGDAAITNTSDAEYTVSVANANKLATATIWFDVDGTFFSGKDVAGLGGFDVLGDIVWQAKGDSLYSGRVTLTNLDGGVTSEEYLDILKLTLSAKGEMGATGVKITRIDLSGYDEEDEAVYFESIIRNGEVETSIGQYFSPYDVNRDLAVDQLDLTTAQGYFRAAEGDANWDEVAARADINKDGKVDIEDFILILNNIVW